MAISKPRNRVVLFRLTQEEYAQVQQACAEESARTFGARLAFDDWRAMIAHPEIDAIAVVLRVPSLPDLPGDAVVELEVSDIDLLELTLHCEFRQRIDSAH